MKFSTETRYNLIKYAFKNIDLHYTIDKKNIRLNDLLANNIVIDTLYHITKQIEEYDKLLNNELNHVINHTISVLKVSDQYYKDRIQEILGMMAHYKIGKTADIDNIIIDNNNDYQLIENCRLYLELYRAGQNKNGQYEDNEIAADWFIFEKVIKQTAINLYGERNVRQKIKGKNDIGQGLFADTIIKHNKEHLLVDAKFYDTNIINAKNKLYKHQNNRFQMCSYMTEMRDTKEIRDDNIKGLIVHALDSKKYNKYIESNHHSINIGYNKINLELINIECTAAEVIKQIENMLLYYI